MISRARNAGQEQQSPQASRAAQLVEGIETPQHVFPSLASDTSLGSLVQQLSPKQEPLHHRLLEEVLSINRMLETINAASNRSDERCAGCEASTVELKRAFQDMRRDIDGVQSRFLDLSEVLVARETMAADIGHLHSLQQELHVHLNEGTQQLQHLQSQVQAQLAEVHHEASLVSAQQQLQGEKLQALQVQLSQHFEAQGDQQQAAEHVRRASEPEQYVASMKDLQHSELEALRQELQQAIKTSNRHTEGIAELHKHCEELAMVVESLAKEPSKAVSQTSTSAAAPTEEQAGAFAAFAQETRSELHATLTLTFEELRGETRALADQVARHGLDLEAERATRALDLEGERAACAGIVSEVATMRVSVGQLSERLTMACREALATKSSDSNDNNDENIRAEVAHCLALHREALDVRLSELAEKLVASAQASTLVARTCGEEVRAAGESNLAQHRVEVEQRLVALAAEMKASADAAVLAAQGCAVHHCESMNQRLSVFVAKDDLRAEVEANIAQYQEQASASTLAVNVADKLFSELAVERDARVQEHAGLAAYIEQANSCMEESHSQIAQRVGDLGHLLQATDTCLTDAVHKELDSLHGGLEMLATQVYAGKPAPEVLSGTKRTGELLQREMSDVASLADQIWRGVKTY